MTWPVRRSLLDPRQIRHGDPDGTTVDGEADVSGIGVAGGDGNYGSLPDAVEIFASPAVGYFEVFIHGF